MHQTPRSHRYHIIGMAVTAWLAMAGCRVDIPIWKPAKAGPFEVEEIRDIAYRPDTKLLPLRNKLDLIVPRGQSDYPVVVLVHGGAWVIGDNRCCGLYTSVGQFLASQGIGVVLPNYRLSPGVKHPDHVRDLARVMAWTRANIGNYGGNPRRVFLMGHSAGGHLVSLLATDESYLKAEGMSSADIKGVISVSGVYRIPPGVFEFTLGGNGPLALRADQMLPVRCDDRAAPAAIQQAAFGLPIPAKLNVFQPAFGNDARERELASPLTHVRRGLPPFLILFADKDLPSLPGMAIEFETALQRQGCDARLLMVEQRNHNSLMFSAIQGEDPAAAAMIDFIRRIDRK